MLKIKNCPRCGKKKGFWYDDFDAFRDNSWCYNCRCLRSTAIHRLLEIEYEKEKLKHEKDIEEMIKYIKNERKKNNRS